MADPENNAGVEDLTGDVEMTAGDGEGDGNGIVNEGNNGGARTGDGMQEDVKKSPRVTFIEYLKSPIVELLVGSGDEQALLSAHQGLLVRCPFFSDAISELGENPKTRRIELENEDLDSVGCFLQYLYTGEYFPRKVDDGADAPTLEVDPELPSLDDSGEQLLKHARVYALAEKLGIPDLKALAHSKVHRINSSAKGEIAYARFVYASTPRDDTTIRKPIASFWGQRSHVLRHEAEDEFKKLCLEFPEFGFDVLSFVLDARERKATDRHTEEPKSTRKRLRVSGRDGS
ncbi:hypothetical protein MMC09_002684 [Bachmanniomyces sp. S44760]|nr:hypothetical protein [Bachmanniomyces sp. S44760]